MNRFVSKALKMIAAGSVAFGLAACADEKPAAQAGSADNSDKVTVLMATDADTKPFIYTNDKNEIIGYDAEVVYAVAEKLPQYNFVFEITDFPSIFTGIDAGRYQMGVNSISWKAEREEKYLFSGEYVGYNRSGVVVRKEDADQYGTLADLAGKSTYTGSAGLFSQVFCEKFNDENPDNPINLIYTDANGVKKLQDLEAGAIDFMLEESVIFKAYCDEFPSFNEKLTFAPISDEEAGTIQDPYSFFIYPKTEFGEKLRADVDQALKELKEDGTIAGLGMKYFGYDPTGK